MTDLIIFKIKKTSICAKFADYFRTLKFSFYAKHSILIKYYFISRSFLIYFLKPKTLFHFFAVISYLLFTNFELFFKNLFIYFLGAFLFLFVFHIIS
jgi:hypothetical protein